MDKYKILIVDDIPKNIQVLASSLANDNYEIEFTTNGKDALDWVKNEPFDLLLLDVMMPEMDGFTVCSKIKEIPEKASIPIIFITAKNDIESISKGFEVGGVDYITKPFNKTELLARVKTHLELKRHKDGLEELVDLRTQELQKAYKDLEILDVAKGEFLSMLSHEIRTPLNGILGFINLLKVKVESDKLKQYVTLLDESASRLDEFSVKALLITELRIKRHKPEIVDTNVKYLIINALQPFDEELKNKSIEINDSSLDDNIRIQADLNLFTMSLEEIFKNILEHSPDTSEISILVKDEISQLEIRIIDNGNGFSQQALDSLFHPFSFGQKHINEKVGLGLHFARIVMDTHQAKISAGNNEDGGAYVQILKKKA